MRHFIRTRPFLALVLVAGAGALSGCGEKNTFQPPPPPPVTIAQPLQQTVTNFHEETGTTEAVDRVEIRARVQGFLEQIQFEEGSDVEEGTVLYVIEQRLYKANVASARAALSAAKVALEKAEIEYKRQESLFKENATSERNVVAAKAERDGARADVEAAEANLDRAEIELDYTEVRTPISGRVGETLVKKGNLVDDQSETHLTTVIRYDPIYAKFNISENDLLRILEGTPRDERRESKEKTLKLYLARATDTGFPFEGRFDYADLAVDQSTGTYAIRGVFPNPDESIVPGLFVRIRIPMGVLEDALLIPEIALGADQAGRYVLVVNSENNVDRKNVTVGSKHGDMVVISEGIEPDDWVIVQGVQRARPGAAVTPERTELVASFTDPGQIEPADEAPAADANTPPATDKSAAVESTNP